MNAKLWYVATYGDLGLQVEFYDCPLAYGRASRTAEREHREGDLDTFTHGSAEVWPPRIAPAEAKPAHQEGQA